MAESKLAGNLTLQIIASYNVSSVVLVFSMLDLGCILISDLVVATLLMYSLPGMILLYLAMPFLHQRCFWMRYHHFCKDEYSIVTQIMNSQMK